MIATQPKTSADPELVRVLRLYNDVTERLKQSHEVLAAEVCRLRDELTEKNRELQRHERLAALGEMAAGVAHEIRNPLGGIGLYASLLERDLEDRPREQTVAKKISAGVLNLESIVRDILAFAGGGAPRKERLDLAQIVSSAFESVRTRAEADSVLVESALVHGFVVEGDAGQMERAIVNLLLNAIDAAGRGGNVWVEMRSNVDEGFASVAVEDDGPGIPEAQLHRVFNPFFTTKESGTGLGLSIVHRIAEEHGGRVTAGRSRRGGASLVFTLPLAQVNENDLQGGIE